MAAKFGNVWVAMVFLLMSLALVACRREPAEQRLRVAVQELQTAIEARDSDAVEEVLAADFIGPEGLDREGARRLAAVMFLRHNDVGASLGPLDIELKGGNAVVRFPAVVRGGELLSGSSGAYDVETGWREESGEWRLYRAQWTPVL